MPALRPADLVSTDAAVIARLWTALTVVMAVLAAALWVVAPGGSLTGFETIVVYLLLVPAGVPILLGRRVPELIGAHGVAFPRLFRATFHIQLAAAALLVTSVVMRRTDEVDASWNFFTAASCPVPGLEVDLRILGVLLVAVATALTTINAMATIHVGRNQELPWHRLPAGVVAIYCRSVVAGSCAPVAALAMVLLLLERHAGAGLFWGAAGGDPLLFQHVFWFALHPLLVTSLLPALGMVLQATERGGATRAQRAALYVATGASVLAWGQHLHGSSPLHAITVSVYALVAIPPLAYLATQAARAMVTSGGLRGVPLMAAAVVTLLAATFGGRELMAAVPSLSVGLDLMLFGTVGLALLALTVLAGLVVGWTPSAPRWPMSSASAPGSRGHRPAVAATLQQV
jgi:cytochrome c oxidase subunit 1